MFPVFNFCNIQQFPSANCHMIFEYGDIAVIGCPIGEIINTRKPNPAIVVRNILKANA